MLPLPKMAAAICDNTVSPPSSTTGLRWWANVEMPRKPTPKMAAIMARVWEALRDSGFLKAGTPLEMASTPDSTTAPELNARSSTNSVAPAMRSWFSSKWWASWADVLISWRSPVNIL